MARQQREAQQQAALAEAGKQVPGYASAAKTLSETTTPNGGNALESVLDAAAQNGGRLL
jgi:hypothetical protein